MLIWSVGQSSSGVNSFATIQPDHGTSPVADSSSDTLTLTSSDGSITITGNATTDTIDFIVNSASLGPSFVTMATPAGTSPVATSPTDTLTWANGAGITITGNSGTKTITVASTITQYTDEMAQDAVGTILTDTASIDFTYNDASNTISAVVLPAGVDHNSLANLTTGDPHTQYVKDFGTSVDNEILRWDGTDARLPQQSGIQISDAFVIAPTTANSNLILDGNGTGIVQLNTGTNAQFLPKARPAAGSLIAPAALTINTFTGITAWTSLSSFLIQNWQNLYDSSTADESFTVTSSGGLTIKDNATPIAASLFRVVNNGSSTEFFKVLSSGIVVTGSVLVGNLSLAGNTVSSTSGGMTISTTASGLLITPTGGDVCIGTSTASGGNTADLRINKLGLLGSDISTTAIVNFSGSSTARQSLFFQNTYTGSSSTNASIVGQIIDTGTNATLTNTNVVSQYTLKTATHTTNTVSGFITQLGIDPSIAIASGTYTHYGLRSAVSNQGIGGTHTGGTFRRYGLYQEAILALGGAPTADLRMGSFWNDSMNFITDTPIIFDSTLTALGDTAIKYVNANTDLEVTVDGVLSFIHDADKNISKLDFKLDTVSTGIYIKEGTNATMGVATLVAGTVVVSTTKVTASSRIQLTAQSLGTVTVGQGLAVSARTAGTSFTILSGSALDTSTVSWIIFEPS